MEMILKKFFAVILTAAILSPSFAGAASFGDLVATAGGTLQQTGLPAVPEPGKETITLSEAMRRGDIVVDTTSPDAIKLSQGQKIVLLEIGLATSFVSFAALMEYLKAMKIAQYAKTMELVSKPVTLSAEELAKLSSKKLIEYNTANWEWALQKRILAEPAKIIASLKNGLPVCGVVLLVGGMVYLAWITSDVPLTGYEVAG